MKRAMRVLLYAGAALAVLCYVCALAACATRKVIPPPTKDRPYIACHVTCPLGYTPFRRQHLCRGGKRHFEDVRVVGRDTERAPDGAVTRDLYRVRYFDGTEASFPVDDFEIGTCDALVRQLVAARSAELRGQHVGEDAYGRPTGRDQ